MKTLCFYYDFIDGAVLAIAPLLTKASLHDMCFSAFETFEFETQLELAGLLDNFGNDFCPVPSSLMYNKNIMHQLF